eukprot:14922329-Alexandrium_andersonii.AAC.1
MSASLVGSEMCIRDRDVIMDWRRLYGIDDGFDVAAASRAYAGFSMHPAPVSYTHLTLPTICSV